MTDAAEQVIQAGPYRDCGQRSRNPCCEAKPTMGAVSAISVSGPYVISTKAIAAKEPNNPARGTTRWIQPENRLSTALMIPVIQYATYASQLHRESCQSLWRLGKRVPKQTTPFQTCLAYQGPRALLSHRSAPFCVRTKTLKRKTANHQPTPSQRCYPTSARKTR